MKKIFFRKLQRAFALLIMCFPVIWGGCTNYLSIKPDQSLTVPQKGEDLMALLNDVAVMNYDYAGGLAELGADNVFIPYTSWTSIFNEMDRMTYVWHRTPVNLTYWNPGYRRILACNTVLDLLDDIRFTTDQERDEVQGVAKFFRGYTFFDLVQVFSVAYDEETAKDRLGIALRLSSDVSLRSTRASLQETYEQIISDLTHACALLPDKTPMYPTRPNRFAAYGALARVYLSMGRYDEAKTYADSCLVGQSYLLDYNDYAAESNYPFARFNEEVIFYSQLRSNSTMLSESRARVFPQFLESYEDSDLRKELFFKIMPDGLSAFTGDYGQNSNATKFNGLTKAEILLIRAECLAREGRLRDALVDLNELLAYRYDRDLFVPLMDISDQKAVLGKILDERRKELIYRGLRWTDLRRLEAEFVSPVARDWDEAEYKKSRKELLDFAFLIPTTIIEYSGMEQN